MARNPDNFARRNAIAQARGFTSFYQYRIAAAAHPADGRILPRRSLGGSGQEAVYTRSESALASAIRRGARNDLVLYARVTILEPDDDRPITEWRRRDVELWADGGWRADNAAEAIEGGEGIAFAVLKATLDAMDKYPGPILDVLLRATA